LLLEQATIEFLGLQAAAECDDVHGEVKLVYGGEGSGEVDVDDKVVENVEDGEGGVFM
jgi:hypothetical protein